MSNGTMPASSPLNLAILDDYQNIATAKFSHLKLHLTSITSFPETLHPSHNDGDKAALISRLKPYHIISTMLERTPFSAEVISPLPNLKYLLITGHCNRAIDQQACAEWGILVTGTTGLGAHSQKLDSLPHTGSTTEHTWALILGMARNIARDDAVVKSGGWQGSFAAGLERKTLGSLGSLGTATEKIGALAFGMRVVAWSSNLTQDMADEKAAALGLPAGAFEVVSTLLKTLKEGKIRGAALDAFDMEPLPGDSAWRTTRRGVEGRSEGLLPQHMGYEEQAENLVKWK
ncbi:D-isomer specific 2-hydroxyacid dehydrogenase [Blastomyces dermatitidis ER-3]|uniref:D-isomer specific 2-hydroxyacid dehydrogenase n=1 Tax=Ajellomyces dermatitidis (strain ER-3 / ATCC MYA-2586) TaxID=559297 RepID=A0ABP2EQ20_AJEDR|nr:D-isomer specific 2-hydroxyacid dehydrogenase [Blastomyces dermatitidis ER-3]EEQ85663.2 D-isomer specific 2-hydroxyacid dehydrogenase [Blastomyces dermatitidis ER-3]